MDILDNSILAALCYSHKLECHVNRLSVDLKGYNSKDWHINDETQFCNNYFTEIVIILPQTVAVPALGCSVSQMDKNEECLEEAIFRY